MAQKKIVGYLPNDTPPLGRMLVLGFQHVLAMFPATILVALLVGFDVGTVLAVSGLATITALILSKQIAGKFIPLYYGSSFSYIAATLAITNAEFGVYAQDKVALAQVGIVATGVVNILVGLIVRRAGGRKFIDKFLPPIITGSVAAVIGIALSAAALNMAAANWLVAFITLLATIIFSVYLQGKGFLGLIPVLLGALVGILASALFGLVDLSPVGAAAWFALPKITFPAFTSPKAWESVAAIAIIAIATIPESTAHLYQISLYVDNLATNMGKKKYNLRELIGLNLILDGLGDMINGMFGGVAGTNYGENNSLMVITRNYSGPTLITAGIMAIMLGFIGKLSAAVGVIPIAVSGGLAIYFFGLIGMQGVALIQAEKVNLYDPRQLAIGATILVLGIGGHIGLGGNIPLPIPGVFPDGLPAIAFAAVAGIVLNLVFMVFKTPEGAELKVVDLED
ncbi:MAG: solute carrier family 23 protein [Pelolinea sp.]|nr:solute carrier family 23 protein [Pelolinea sp.]